MQKKPNTKSRVTDFLIIVLCAAGACASGIAFWREYNQTLVKLNERPVGTIVFKKRTAQRRFNERVVWDRLKEESPVYNGDTIRTIELSEVVITFRDEQTSLSLNENTLIQVFYDDLTGARLDFSEGNLEVASGSRGIVISNGSSAIVVGEDSQAALNQSGEGLGLSVLTGQASVDGTELEQGGMIALDSSGAVNTDPMIAMTSFGASAYIAGSTESVPVVFSWNAANFGSGTHVIVEVAQDRGFTRITETRDVIGVLSVSIPLQSGNYWWRAYPASAGSSEPVNRIFPSGSLELFPPVELTLTSPAQGLGYAFPGESRVPFSWSAVEGASEYLLEVSADQDMSTPVVSRRVKENSVVETGLGNGRWYWRVTPLYPAWVKGSAAAASVVHEFAIARSESAPAPVLTFPPQDGTVYAGSSARRLLWTYDAGAAPWRVELADNAGLNNPFVTQTVNANYFSLPGEALEPGKIWYWRVTALGGAVPASSEAGKFTVSLGNPPPPKAVIAPAPPLEEPVPVTPEPLVMETQPEPAVTPDLEPAPVAVITPPPASRPEPAAVPPPQPRPDPAPVTPEPAVTPRPEPAPAAVITPPPVQSPPARAAAPEVRSSPPENPLLRLTRVSGSGTVSEAVPADGYILYTDQLASAASINFVWEGKASQYRFALYRTNGEELIPPSNVQASRYVLSNPGTLIEGDYVWQIYEADRRGNWGEYPSTANCFTVVKGSAALKTLQTQDPGVLYGNR